jgi:hypothetical protein
VSDLGTSSLNTDGGRSTILLDHGAYHPALSGDIVTGVIKEITADPKCAAGFQDVIQNAVGAIAQENSAHPGVQTGRQFDGLGQLLGMTDGAVQKQVQPPAAKRGGEFDVSSPAPPLVVDDVGMRLRRGVVGDDVVPNEPIPGSVNSAAGDVRASVQARDVHGDITINNNDRGKPRVAWPHRVGVVPMRAGCFQARMATRDLKKAVAEGDTVVLTAPEPAVTRVLSGLGGVGKTQLAADYAERAWAAEEIDLLVWVAASTRDAIVSAYATGANELGWDSDEDAENASRRFLAGLASRRKRWLVVLDDLQSLADVQGLWPPHAPTGRVVATTRRRDAAWAGDRRRVILVDVFTPAESVSYLTAKFANHAHLAPGVAALATDLDHLPLALAQAAAYMIDEDLTCEEYRARLAERRRTLAELVPEPNALPDDHRDTVAATWSLSIDAANTMRPAGLAPHVLKLASVLDPNGIPAAVFTSPDALAYLREAVTVPIVTNPTTATAETGLYKQIGCGPSPPAFGRIGNPDITADDVRSALRCLHRLNLATVVPSERNRTVRVHAIVQRATRDRLGTTLGLVARAAADSLLHVWPDIERDQNFAQVLRSNTQNVHNNGDEHLWQPSAHAALFRLGRSLGESGLITAAQSQFQTLHTSATDRLGPDHPDTLISRSDLAYWRGVGGDVAGAIGEFQELLADRVRVLGPDHPDTLLGRSNLAYWENLPAQS